MNNFLSILLRLKESLNLQSDKDVAKALGLSDKAFNARKRREKFPEDKLLALAQTRQDLALDVGYILTGVKGSPVDHLISSTGQSIEEGLASLEKESPIVEAVMNQLRLDAAKKSGGIYELERLIGMYSLLSYEAQQAAFAMVQHLRWQEYENKPKDVL